MPQAIGVLGAGAIGLFGTTVAATSFSAMLVGGAIVGAAVGGLSSAVMGGDIGKGILFGAVGGAVTGGIMGSIPGGPAGFATAGTAAGTAGGTGATGWGGALVSSTVTSPSVMTAGSSLGGLAAAGAGATGAAGGLTNAGLIKAQMYGSLAEGAVGMAGNIFGGMGEEEMVNAKMEFDASQAALSRQHQKEMAELQAGLDEGKYPDYAAELAEKRRQFDLDLEERRRVFDTQLNEARAKRTRGSTAVKSQSFKRGGVPEKPTPILTQVEQGTPKNWVSPIQEAQNG